MITELDPALIRHSEYDIEVNDTENAELKDANKLVIIPVLERSEIEFRKNKQTLLSILINTIEKIDMVSSLGENLKKESDSALKITLTDADSSNKSITLTVKNKKHTSRIQRQILLLKEAAQDPSVKKSIMSSLNPNLCSLCLENDLFVNFSSVGKLCLGCFEKEYGKILLRTEKPIAEYYG
jgi:hypothetical protein